MNRIVNSVVPKTIVTGTRLTFRPSSGKRIVQQTCSFYKQPNRTRLNLKGRKSKIIGGVGGVCGACAFATVATTDTFSLSESNEDKFKILRRNFEVSGAIFGGVLAVGCVGAAAKTLVDYCFRNEEQHRVKCLIKDLENILSYYRYNVNFNDKLKCMYKNNNNKIPVEEFKKMLLLGNKKILLPNNNISPFEIIENYITIGKQEIEKYDPDGVLVTLFREIEIMCTSDFIECLETCLKSNGQNLHLNSPFFDSGTTFYPIGPEKYTNSLIRATISLYNERHSDGDKHLHNFRDRPSNPYLLDSHPHFVCANINGLDTMVTIINY